MVEKKMLIRSDDCPLSELASRIKEIVETTQNPEDPNFLLLPYIYDFNGKNGTVEVADPSEERFLVFWGNEWGLKEMIHSLPESIAIEYGGNISDLSSGLEREARSGYSSLDSMIQHLQKEEQKGEHEGRAGAQPQEKKEHKIYLSLPPTSSPKAFKTMIDNLKNLGAKFDSYNKFWYVTPDVDLNKFKGFLGLPYEYINEKGKENRAREQAKKEEKNQEGRESVKNKLGKNKDAVERNASERKEPVQGREEPNRLNHNTSLYR